MVEIGYFVVFERQSRAEIVASGEAQRNLWFDGKKHWHSEGVQQKSRALSELKSLAGLQPEVTLCFTTGYFLMLLPKLEEKSSSLP